MTRLWLVTVPVLAAIAAPAFAQSREAKLFGTRERVTGMRLSPDGRRYLALVAQGARGMRVVVGDVGLESPAVSVLSSDGEPERLTHCNWASTTRLVCGIYGVSGKGREALGFTRMVALDADGRNLALLSARSSDDALGVMQSGGTVIDWFGDEGGGAVLMTRQFVPTTQDQTRGYGVERVDPVTLRRTIVERPRLEAEEFITDGHGAVRILGIRPQDGSGYGKTSIRYQFRRAGAKAWEPLSVVTGDSQTRSGFDPYAVDRDLDVAYGFDADNGRTALFRVALDGSGKREKVFGRDDVDVDGLVRIGRQRRVVGVTFATDRRQTEFFDPVLKKLQVSLGRAIPKLPLVSFVDASTDEQRLLLWAGSDVNPGEYYVFDKKTRHLDALVGVRPELADVPLAAVRSMTYTAADGTAIPAYLTLPPGQTSGKGLPAIVMPHGGPSARDEWGFDWLAQFFAARGYAVFQPNFRGSSGYGSTWFQDNGFRSWKIAIGDVNDAGRWLVKAGIADPARLAIVGWSYGGYAALQSPVLAPDLFKAIVAVAPVTDLATLREEHRTFNDYRLVDAFIGQGEHVRAGSPAQNAAAIRAPVLLVHGDLDRNVGVGESRMMAARLKKAGRDVDYLEFEGLDHQLDDSDARTAMLDRADTFLRKAMGL